MEKNNKTIWIIVGIIVAMLLFSSVSNQGQGTATSTNPIQNIINNILHPSGGGGSSGNVYKPSSVNNGASMKAIIIDENGNIKEELVSPSKQTFSIISSPTPSGYKSISPPSCSVNCNFLAITAQLDNSAGDSEVTVTSVDATTQCSSGNTNTGCSSISNVFGLASIADTKRGNMNSKYSSLVPIIIQKSALSSAVSSDGMSLDEVALGLIDFKLSVSGNYKDTSGNDVALSGKSGTVTLRAAPSTCTDNTVVDPDSTNADEITYCSVPNKGKYCRVGSAGVSSLTDRASLCGCPTGQNAVGEVCKATSCVPNSCIPGTVDYCLADGRSVERRCQQCTDGILTQIESKCPKDTYGSSAISCDPAITGVLSQCVYSAVSGGGFLVNFAPVNINTIDACGDGIKSDSEQCDKYDFGGLTCASPEVVGTFTTGTLGCTGSCTFDTSACIKGYVKFRTYDLAYGANNAVAYSSICGNTLTKYGRTSGACTTKYCDMTPDFLVPTSTGTTKFFVSGSDVCVCNPGETTHTYALRYSTSDPDAYQVSSNKLSENSLKEVSCIA